MDYEFCNCGNKIEFGSNGEVLGICNDCFDKIGYEEKGYTGKPCVYCGRTRVVEFLNGKCICEKCEKDQETKEFDEIFMKLGGF